MKTEPRSNAAPRKEYRRRSAIITITLLLSLIAPTYQLSLSTVISALPITSWNEAPAPTIKTQPASNSVTSLNLAVPPIQLTMSDIRQINGIYTAQDPKSIPTGFVRACHKAGGFAPRPLWDEVTNGFTPWFEKDGCFVYFNCVDGKWWIDDEDGCPLYLACPEGSLLLPPTVGWVHLTGRRGGVPRMRYL